MHLMHPMHPMHHMRPMHPMQDVVVAFDISRRTYHRILLNFVWAYGYNVVSDSHVHWKGGIGGG